jgi:hypothetical protein
MLLVAEVTAVTDVSFLLIITISMAFCTWFFSSCPLGLSRADQAGVIGQDHCGKNSQNGNYDNYLNRTGL